MGIFIDLKEPFHLSDRNALLHKIKTNGDRKVPLNIITSSLSCRRQYVNLPDATPTTKPVPAGAPELADFLFRIFIPS